ncbi:hypothetical protein QTP88_012956 [Uroleucon formosanum]
MSSSFRILYNVHTWHCLSTKSVCGEDAVAAAASSSAECIYIYKMCVVKRRQQKPSLSVSLAPYNVTYHEALMWLWRRAAKLAAEGGWFGDRYNKNIMRRVLYLLTAPPLSR